MPTEEPDPLPDFSRPSSFDWWPFLRVALIAWTVVGVVRFVCSLAGIERVEAGPGHALAVLNFVGSASLLLGSVGAKTEAWPNTALTIGAAMLVLYAVVTAAVGGRAGDDHLLALLGGLQHVAFPVAVVAIKICAPGQFPRQEPPERLGATGWLLGAAQVPSVVALGLAAALISNVYRPFWAAGIWLILLCIAAPILSAALSLAFLRTPYRALACGAAIAHVVFLVGLVAAVALMLSTSKPSYHGPGGY